MREAVKFLIKTLLDLEESKNKARDKGQDKAALSFAKDKVSILSALQILFFKEFGQVEGTRELNLLIEVERRRRKGSSRMDSLALELYNELPG